MSIQQAGGLQTVTERMGEHTTTRTALSKEFSELVSVYIIDVVMLLTVYSRYCRFVPSVWRLRSMGYQTEYAMRFTPRSSPRAPY